MFRRFAKEELEKLSPSLTSNDTGLIQDKKAKEFVDRVQRIVEGANFSFREYNLKLDDVINEQRNVVYHLRNKALEENDLVSIIIPRIEATAHHLINKYCSEEVIPEKWPLPQLKAEIENILLDKEITFPSDQYELPEIQEVVLASIHEHIEILESYVENEILQYGLKQIMTAIIDHNWIKHLENMTRLKEGIGMRHYQQEDPMRLYQQEGLELFEQMYAQLSKELSIQTTALIKSLQQ